MFWAEKSLGSHDYGTGLARRETKEKAGAPVISSKATLFGVKGLRHVLPVWYGLEDRCPSTARSRILAIADIANREARDLRVEHLERMWTAILVLTR